jgi:hypothetical protein
LAPRSSWANADVAATNAVISPSTTTTSARSLRSSVPPCIASATSASLLPGETTTTVRATTWAKDSAPSALASPAPAMISGTVASANCSAKARAWLKPSPNRNRTNAP